MFDQPIVERKSSSPLATSLLVLSAVCLLGATIFVGAQLKGLTAQGAEGATSSAQYWAKRNQTPLIDDIEQIVGTPAEE
jgi:hypothetical protein